MPRINMRLANARYSATEHESRAQIRGEPDGSEAFVVVSVRSRQEALVGVMEFFPFLGLIEDGG
jgi:hypothetical protein